MSQELKYPVYVMSARRGSVGDEGHAGGLQTPVKSLREGTGGSLGENNSGCAVGEVLPEEILAFVKLDGIGMHIFQET